MLLECADCDSPKSLLLYDVLAACERYHGLPPFSVAPTASQLMMVSDLLDAIAYEMRPISSTDGPDATLTNIDEMPSLDPADSQHGEEAACQICGSKRIMVEHTRACCRKQMHESIFGCDSEDVEDEYEDDAPPMSPRIARTKPKRHASMSALLGIRKSLWAEKDVASITPAHEPKRGRFL